MIGDRRNTSPLRRFLLAAEGFSAAEAALLACLLGAACIVVGQKLAQGAATAADHVDGEVATGSPDRQDSARPPLAWNIPVGSIPRTAEIRRPPDFRPPAQRSISKVGDVGKPDFAQVRKPEFQPPLVADADVYREGKIKVNRPGEFQPTKAEIQKVPELDAETKRIIAELRKHSPAVYQNTAQAIESGRVKVRFFNQLKDEGTGSDGLHHYRDPETGQELTTDGKAAFTFEDTIYLPRQQSDGDGAFLDEVVHETNHAINRDDYDHTDPAKWNSKQAVDAYYHEFRAYYSGQFSHWDSWIWRINHGYGNPLTSRDEAIRDLILQNYPDIRRAYNDSSRPEIRQQIDQISAPRPGDNITNR